MAAQLPPAPPAPTTASALAVSAPHHVVAQAQAHAPAGTHVLADLNGIDAARLSDSAFLETLLREAATSAGAQILFSHFHGFGDGQGVTGVVLLAESHITIHTWPECGFAAADIFMCGSAQPELALALIAKALQPNATRIQSLHRSSTGVTA
ncbi:adenosylmethionine decarboxylase [Duganella sp. FT80W]|uniref:S-adenosylmethionine decarboxylase proenzyme n=1 Tax=Duganella guangzhouensis TaxID=2666084 RepID=A0A6I2KYR0_9BURK|nr:adenosylmethionine decarboxylase [Duganella guangzhouensis]